MYKYKTFYFIAHICFKLSNYTSLFLFVLHVKYINFRILWNLKDMINRFMLIKRGINNKRINL